MLAQMPVCNLQHAGFSRRAENAAAYSPRCMFDAYSISIRFPGSVIGNRNKARRSCNDA